MASVDDLWLADFGEPCSGEPAYHRPALVVGPPRTFGPDFPFVVVCPLTRTARGLSLHVEIEPTEDSGLDDISYIQCELLRSISRRRLVHHLGHIDPVASRQVTDILSTYLDR